MSPALQADSLPTELSLLYLIWGVVTAQRVKNLPAMQETQETWVRSLGWEDPLEKDLVFSRILAWRMPRTEEPGGAMGLQRVRHR